MIEAYRESAKSADGRFEVRLEYDYYESKGKFVWIEGGETKSSGACALALKYGGHGQWHNRVFVSPAGNGFLVFNADGNDLVPELAHVPQRGRRPAGETLRQRRQVRHGQGISAPPMGGE